MSEQAGRLHIPIIADIFWPRCKKEIESLHWKYNHFPI